MNDLICSQGKLLITISGHNQGEKVAVITKQSGATGGTILIGRGTAENSILQMLGIGDSDKDIILTVASEKNLPQILQNLSDYTKTEGRIRGIAFVVNVSAFFKRSRSIEEKPYYSPRNTERNTEMGYEIKYQLILVIVNSGYADDVMAAARKEGAGGGTIINARGTGKEEDVKFFGITIVPEKELILILTEKEKASAILDSINSLSCLSEPGSGIAFYIDVENYINLGKK